MTEQQKHVAVDAMDKLDESVKQIKIGANAAGKAINRIMDRCSTALSKIDEETVVNVVGSITEIISDYVKEF